MRLRYSLSLIVLLLIGLGISTATPSAAPVSQADSTQQQQTINAAVEALFTQTAQVDMTRVVESAFNAALTATVASSVGVTPTPTPPPPTISVEALEVISTQQLDLKGGPLRTSGYLAPSGEHFAHLDGDQICIYAITGEQQRCTPLNDELQSLDAESVRWSPDSRYLVMTVDFFLYFAEPDIWMLDATTGKFTNLTDDKVEKLDIGELSETEALIDVVPQWSSDSERVFFIRYSADTDMQRPRLFSVDRDGGDLQPLANLRTTYAFSIYNLDISPDGTQITYNPFLNGAEVPSTLWISDLDGGNAEIITQSRENISPFRVEFSPDKQFVLTILPNFTGINEPESSIPRIVDAQTGQTILLDNEHYVSGAGWSPQGSALAYTVYNSTDTEASGLYLTNAPGEEGKLVLQGEFFAPTSRNYQSIMWAANNTLLLTRAPEFQLVIVQLGEK